MNRIKDLRNNMTLADAERLANRAALLAHKLDLEDSRIKKRLAEIKDKHAEATQAERDQLQTLMEDLSEYIQAHKEQFQNPRTVETNLCEFGLRQATELRIVDEATLISHILNRGLEQCYEKKYKLNKTAIRKYIDETAELPGAFIHTGDTIVFKVRNDLIERVPDREAS